MYIKLGSTKVNYISPQTDDFMILSEVVDSSLSYHRPVLVRTIEELDIWFGDSFTDRDYFLQLLESGIVLYLYKPIQINPDKTFSDYIDYSKYEIIDEAFNNISEIEKKYIGDNKYEKIFRLISEHEYTEIIFLKDLEMPVELDKLPQNLNFISNSQNNRDTLILLSNSGYLSPSFNNSSDTFFEKGDSTELKTDLSNINYSKLSEGYLSSNFKLKFENDFLDSNKPFQYLEITTVSENGEFKYNLLVFTDKSEEDLKKLEDEYGRKIYIDIFSKCSSSKIFFIKEGKDKLLEELENLGYVVRKEGDEYLIKYSYLVPVNYFYDIQGVSMTPEYILSNDQL